VLGFEGEVRGGAWEEGRGRRGAGEKRGLKGVEGQGEERQKGEGGLAGEGGPEKEGGLG
jgi:hypothetical protein